MFIQMLQLALRQQQLHAAHVQIKLQHRSNLVAGEHHLQHLHQHQQQQQQQHHQQQRATPLGVDQVGSLAHHGTRTLSASDELNVAASQSTTTAGVTWRTHDEPHTNTSISTHTTTSTTVDHRAFQTVSRVCFFRFLRHNNNNNNNNNNHTLAR